MNGRWSWIIRYAIVIGLALVLAYALGEMDLFRRTRFGKTGMNAARLVQFFGYGGALLVFWLMAQRAAAILSPAEAPWHYIKPILLPVATLAVLAAAHTVVLLGFGPLMSKAIRPLYNWAFIGSMVVTCVWLLASLLSGMHRH